MSQSCSSDMLRNLTERIREIELGWADSSTQRRGDTATQRVPCLLGVPGLDKLPAGSLVELLSSSEGAGASSLGLLMALAVASGQWPVASERGEGEGREASRKASTSCSRPSPLASHPSKAIVIIDRLKRFYPPTAVRLGLDLARTVVVHPKKLRDVYAACNLSLRCPAVGAVLAWCEPPSLEFRRLQLAAEAGGGIGFLLRQPGALRSPSFAALRLLLTPLREARERGEGREARARSAGFSARPLSLSSLASLKVDVLRRRHGKAGQTFILEIDHETGDVRASSELATATALSREAGLSG